MSRNGPGAATSGTNAARGTSKANGRNRTAAVKQTRGRIDRMRRSARPVNPVETTARQWAIHEVSSEEVRVAVGVIVDSRVRLSTYEKITLADRTQLYQLTSDLEHTQATVLYTMSTTT